MGWFKKLIRGVASFFGFGGGGGGGGAPQPTSSEAQLNFERERAARERAEGEARQAREEAQRQAEATRRQAEEQQAEFRRLVQVSEQQAREHAERQRQYEQQIAESHRKEQEARATIDRLQAEERAAEAAVQAREAENRARIEAIGLLVTEYNIGIAGASGAGKSTLINSLRGLRSSDPGAARTCAGVECTTDFAKYSWAGTFFALWDMSGGGTRRQPAASYCRDHCLDLFDCIIMLYQGRLSQLDGMILQYAAQHNRVIVVVYTKTDQDVRNMVENDGTANNEADAFRQLRTRVTGNLQQERRELGIPSSFNTPLYFVNSNSFRTGEDKFEEALLLEAMVRSTAKRSPDGATADQIWERVRQAVGLNSTPSE